MMETMPKKDKIYIAGTLNSDAAGYIQNLARMTKYANKIMRLGNTVFSPGNSFIQGLVDGKLQYADFFYNSLELLRLSDAMFIVPGSENSVGVAKERMIADQLNIPIFESIDELVSFNNRPKILCITGESGTGKTTIAKYIEDEWAIPMIQSHTDRKPRFAGETGHIFHIPEDYDKLDKKDMIAWTVFGENRYCCLKDDVKDNNTYIIDEYGALMMQHLNKNNYKMFFLRVKRDYLLRAKNVTFERLERDLDTFWLPDSFYDGVIENNGSKESLYTMVDDIVYDFFLKS